MADIFLSYKREDEARVAPIASGLTSAGLSVWWDRAIPGGDRWRQTIGDQLESASCVIVVWSSRSIGAGGDFVQDEAARAKARGVLLPILIDNVNPPLGFGEVQALDLVGWRGQTDDRRFQNVLRAARAVVSGERRPAPQLSDPRLRLATVVTASVIVMGAALGFAGDIAGIQTGVCRIPGLRSRCAAFGLGGVPTPAEEALWASRPPGDCIVLRAYVERFPRGAYAAEATRRLLAVDARPEQRIEREQRRLPLTVRPTLTTFGTEQAARTDALARAATDAARQCAGFTAAGNRVQAVNVEVSEWRCLPHDGGAVCGFDGESICDLDVARRETRQVCP